ncbi:MAG: glycogen debranching protein, partial [Candidatus Hydrogenedentes bacterium]|nr:glycogen debranching protein [Candidatus Hydrogenedentota bacterium]
FGEYCRDTLISLPGLTLVTGNFSAAREILSAVSGHFSRGMLPNRFDERTGNPEYTSADASLWFIYAVQSYLAYTADYEFVRTALYDNMTDVIEHYRKGTGRSITMDRNGLLDAGTATNQMTWMNATVAGQPVTSRHGKAVEVNALWYNALKVVADLARRFGDERAHVFAALATVAKRSFQVSFWNGNGGYLFDCLRQGEVDASIRPNQILTVSLPYPLIDGERAASVVNCVEKELLTPFGLRTLSPGDPGYRGSYEGNPSSRDQAYHQGTVWAWLLGPFITAYFRVHGRSQTTIDDAHRFIEPFRDHLREAGLGTVSEIFDGDPPYTPRGCISKALSVAELLRAYREDILGRKPEP